jgi:hypothetical protein
LKPRPWNEVLDIAAPLFNGDDLDVEIEYEDSAISQFPFEGDQKGIRRRVRRIFYNY